jgi:DNA polymerase-3 subunit beta
LETKEGKLNASALDGFRMAVSSCEVSGSNKDVKIVCPARTLTEIARMMAGDEENIRLYVNKNMLFVEIDDTTLTSRLYVGEFVRKENIYPVEFTTEVVVNRTEMISSIERAAIVIRGNKKTWVEFDIKPGSLTINANSEIGNVTESVTAQTSGKELKIAMNEKYILDALKALDAETVMMSFNTSVSPFTVENAEGGTSQYLILPVRTSNQA